MSHRYGDFPELFWDAAPDERLDPTSPVVLSRLLRRAPIETVSMLVSPDELARRLKDLVIPEHTRIFWIAVLSGVPGVSLPRNHAAVLEGEG
ncbi:MAG: hypothetical protein ACREMK_05195 [Gemmatimonadota bacterium]